MKYNFKHKTLVGGGVIANTFATLGGGIGAYGGVKGADKINEVAVPVMTAATTLALTSIGCPLGCPGVANIIVDNVLEPTIGIFGAIAGHSVGEAKGRNLGEKIESWIGLGDSNDSTKSTSTPKTEYIRKSGIKPNPKRIIGQQNKSTNTCTLFSGGKTRKQKHYNIRINNIKMKILSKILNKINKNR